MKLNAEYWEDRYRNNSGKWDIGHPSPPLTEYAGVWPVNTRILIPGCGHAYEGEWLWKKGYSNVTLMDVSHTARTHFLERVPDFPQEQFIIGDFFEHLDQYDLILEQTFFCALSPGLRDKYVDKMWDLLNDNGILSGVLFTFPLTGQGPPFGGSPEEYSGRFKPKFDILKLRPCYNSIGPRMGNEVFFEVKKRT